ncbi:MAG TPA: hypothetical protein VGS28_02410 [Candidatus Saccharimonadales bacterium]|nr:hypothetical protein [Candidatus Saccharimonadales bacterium]
MGIWVGTNKKRAATLAFLLIPALVGLAFAFTSSSHQSLTATDVTWIVPPEQHINVRLPDLKSHFEAMAALPLPPPMETSGTSTATINVPNSCDKSVSSGVDGIRAFIECMSKNDDDSNSNVNISDVSQQSGNATSTSSSSINVTINQ